MKKELKCKTCGNNFVSYNKNPQFCSHACHSEAMVKSCDRDRVVSLYNSGMTLSEVSTVMSISTKAAMTILRRSGVATRRATPRNQTGQANSRWKGSEASYSAFHFRVESEYGKPKNCDECGESSESKTYDWANLSGEYDNIKDYKRMCRSCHRKYDNGRRKCGSTAQA